MTRCSEPPGSPPWRGGPDGGRIVLGDGAGAAPAADTDSSPSHDQPATAAPGQDHIITYHCGHGAEHAIPSDEVRVMAWGATGFEVACTCGPEPLTETDDPPHDSLLHVASIEGSAPSPDEWLDLEAVRDGWFHETPWQPVESEGKTPVELRAAVRDGMEDLADDEKRNRRGGADQTDKAACSVECTECGAGPGMKCQRPSGHRVRRSHAARKTAAGVDADDDTTTVKTTTDQASLDGWST